jgi:hypothetical protein
MNSFLIGVLVGGLVVPCLLVVAIGVWVLLVRGE